MRGLILGLTLVGCGGGGGAIVGDLETSDSHASFESTAAFYEIADGRLGLYIASGADASCEGVVEYLTSDAPLDPSDLLAGGGCNLTLTASPEDGGVSFTEEQDWLVGFWSIHCSMGEGEYLLEERGGHEDYFWSGPIWTGMPLAHTTSASESGDELTATVEMVDFHGDYSDQGGVDATGSITGSVTATRCPELKGTAVLP